MTVTLTGLKHFPQRFCLKHEEQQSSPWIQELRTAFPKHAEGQISAGPKWRLFFHRGLSSVVFIAIVNQQTQLWLGKKKWHGRKYKGALAGVHTNAHARRRARKLHTHGCQPTSLNLPLHHFTCTPTPQNPVSRQQAS